MVAITFRFPGSDSPDYAATQVLADGLISQRGKLYGLVPAGKALAAAFSYDVLGEAFYATRLYRDLRENNGLVYFVSSAFDMGLTRGVYEADYACDQPNVSKAGAIVVSDLKDMRNKTVSSRELRQAKVLRLWEIPLSESSV